MKSFTPLVICIRPVRPLDFHRTKQIFTPLFRSAWNVFYLSFNRIDISVSESFYHSRCIVIFFRASISAAACLVSSAEVFPASILPLTSHSKPASLKIPYPISPGQVTHETSSCRPCKLLSASRALLGAQELAPLSKAFLRISSPSVPLRPTLPPIPALGFSMKPMNKTRLAKLYEVK